MWTDLLNSSFSVLTKLQVRAASKPLRLTLAYNRQPEQIALLPVDLDDKP